VGDIHRPIERNPRSANTHLVSPSGWQATNEEGPQPLGENSGTFKMLKSKRHKFKAQAGLSTVYKGNLLVEKLSLDELISEDSPEDVQKMEHWLLKAKQQLKFHEASENINSSMILVSVVTSPRDEF
jgi:DNA-binding protein YbaB